MTLLRADTHEADKFIVKATVVHQQTDGLLSYS